MKEFFYTWITFQLMLLGLLSVDAHNQIAEKKFDCHQEKQVLPVIVGAIVPIKVFMPEQREIINYCKDK